jgi:hypothetical protein
MEIASRKLGELNFIVHSHVALADASGYDAEDDYFSPEH